MRTSIDADSIYAQAIALCALVSVDGTADRCSGLASRIRAVAFIRRTCGDVADDMPPERLDEYFAACAALALYDAETFSEAALVRIVTILTQIECAEGGPYHTEIQRNTSGSNAPDPLMNAFIARLLNEYEIRLDPLDAYLREGIRRGSFPYAESLTGTIYVTAPLLNVETARHAVTYLTEMRHKDGSWGTPYETACACSALMMLNGPMDIIERGMECLEILASEQRVSEETDAWSSETAMAALCFEAFQRFELRKEQVPEHERIPEGSGIPLEENARRCVIERVLQRFDCISEPLSAIARHTVDRLMDRDASGQMSMLPRKFFKSLGLGSRRLSDAFIREVCAAHVFGWVAYTIYDDFLDEEGEPPLLPVANVCLRELTAIYRKIGGNAWNQFRMVMDATECANAWEASSCRAHLRDDSIILPDTLPDYAVDAHIADRSLGHALGPLAVCYALGQTPDTPDVRSLRSFFWHYIISKQLCDDLEDWEADLLRGQLNAVGSDVVRVWQLQTGGDRIGKPDMDTLRRIYWTGAVDRTANRINDHASRALIALGRIGILERKDVFSDIIRPYTETAKSVRSQREERLALLQSIGAQRVESTDEHHSFGAGR